MELQKMFIDGEWVEGSTGKSVPTLNPSNGEVLAMVKEGNVEDVDKAIAAAKKSFYVTREWRDMDSQTRADILLQIADAIDAEKEDFAKLDCMDHGKPLREAEADVDDAVHCFRYYAGILKMPHGGVYEVNEGFGKMHSYTVHEPVGVCGLITPWNYPLLMGVWKLAPALAAGNSVVFKPSSNCVLSCVKLFGIFEKIGMPKGSVNLILGPGGITGNRIAESKDVDMVTFTGSTEVGQSIMRAAAGNVKKIGLELGGKSPNVIFADADLDGAVEWAMIGIFLNQGEVCSAGSRIIIEESIKDEFVKRLAKKANAITIGDPMENPDMEFLKKGRNPHRTTSCSSSSALCMVDCIIFFSIFIMLDTIKKHHRILLRSDDAKLAGMPVRLFFPNVTYTLLKSLFTTRQLSGWPMVENRIPS